MRFNKLVTAAVLAAAAFLPFAAQAESFQAGLRMMTVAAAEPIPVALFYPTQAETRAIPMGPFTPRVAMYGPPAPTLKGLILLSHGTGGSEFGHHKLAQRLAQEGYLVAALRHPRDNWQDRSLAGTAEFFSERPKQVSHVLDALLADPEWTAKIPAGHVGAIGHSAGGYTVLALAGGIADPRGLATHCAPGNDDQGFCRLGGENARGAAPRTSLDTAAFDVQDKRIRAVVAFAPLAVVFAPDSLARVQVPLKIYTAEKDDVLNGKYHGGRLHALLPTAEYEEVANAGHFAFMVPLAQSVRVETGNPNEDPPGFDRNAFQGRLENEVAAFFDRTLM